MDFQNLCCGAAGNKYLEWAIPSSCALPFSKQGALQRASFRHIKGVSYDLKIGLIDVDSHNFPNLCLMKLSAYHKAKGHTVEWWNTKERYDLVYKSRVFTDTYSKDTITVTVQELFQSGEALYYGLNALSNNMILCDRKKLKNPNGLILGTPGSGKSFSAKREITNAFLITSDDIIICDPEAEYYPLVGRLKGQVIKVSQNSTQYINPMDINRVCAAISCFPYCEVSPLLVRLLLSPLPLRLQSVCLYRSYRPAARQAAAARWISPHCCSGRKIDLPKYDTGLQGHRIPVNSAVVPCSRYSQGSAGKYITRRLPFCGSRRIHFSRLL